MAQITGDLQIITPIGQIDRMILLESVKVANTIFPSIINHIRNSIASYIPTIFSTSAEYQSIISGQLQHQFGIPDSEASAKLQKIVGKMVDSTQVNFNPFRLRGDTIGGGLEIFAIPSDFADLLNLPEAIQMTEKGKSLPWLEWLLIAGDKIIIYDYYFKPGHFKNSRSGDGIMVIGQSKFWRVPPQFAGTIDDNWITRTIDRYIKDIEAIVETTAQKYL